MLLLESFEASPLVAEPPLVLFETVALPLLAVWLLVLLTVTLLLFVTFRELLLLTVALLVELGPVVSIDTLSEPLPKKPLQLPLEALLSTITVVSLELELLAEPLVAPPALVLPEVLALPLDDRWVLLLVTFKVLVLRTVALLVLLTVARLVELGPVLLKLALDAAAVARPKPAVAIPMAA